MIQRVSHASVSWPEGAEERCNSIGHGLVVLVGAGSGDEAKDVTRMAERVVGMRIFADAEGRTNLSVRDLGGEVLVVSQFTLYADLSRGRRPSFLGAGDPERAAQLVDQFAAAVGSHGIKVQQGRFGAHMQVALENDGPLTLVISSDEWPTRV